MFEKMLSVETFCSGPVYLVFISYSLHMSSVNNSSENGGFE